MNISGGICKHLKTIKVKFFNSDLLHTCLQSKVKFCRLKANMSVKVVVVNSSLLDYTGVEC